METRSLLRTINHNARGSKTEISSSPTDLAELRSVLVHMKRHQRVINNFVEPTDEEKNGQ